MAKAFCYVLQDGIKWYLPGNAQGIYCNVKSLKFERCSSGIV